MDESVKQGVQSAIDEYDVTFEDKGSPFDFYITLDSERLNFRYTHLTDERLERSKTYGRYGFHTGQYFWLNDEDMEAIRESDTSPVIFVFKIYDNEQLHYIPIPKEYQNEQDNSSAIIIDSDIVVPSLSVFPEVLTGKEVIEYLDEQYDRSIPSRIAGKLLSIAGIDTDKMMPGSRDE